MRSLILCCILCCFSVLISNLAAQDAETLLSQAVYEEEVNGDLEGAINIYTRIVTEYPNARPVAAEALLKLGIANEKLGHAKATTYYVQLLNNYADQDEFAIQARARLKRLASATDEVLAPEIDSIAARSNGMLKTSKVLFPAGYYMSSISPDGRYITYRDQIGGGLPIYDRIKDETRNLLPDSVMRSLTSVSGVKGYSIHSVWSQDGKKLAYRWLEDGHYDLRIFDMETGEVRILYPYDAEGVPFPKQWTRDGAFIHGVIWNMAENQYRIVLVDAEDGSINISITLSNNDLRTGIGGTCLSPDGRYLLYDDFNENNKKDLYIMSLDGKFDQLLIGNNGSYARGPKWLEDGKSFLFFSDRSNTSALWKATLDDQMQIKNTELLVDGLGFLHHHIGVTTDSTYYYMTQVRISNLYTATIDIDKGVLGAGEQYISPNLEQRWSPSWSPDASKLAYIRFTEADWESIEIKDIESGVEEVLNLNFAPGRELYYQSYHTPQWSSDGRSLLLGVRNKFPLPGATLVTRGMPEIILADIETGQYRTVVQNGIFAEFGSDEIIYFKRDQSIIEKNLGSGLEKVIYSSELHNLKNMTVSPDGTHLAFFTGPSDQENYYYNELVLLSLIDGQQTVVWSIEDEMDFGWNLEWFKDNQQLLVHITSNDRQQHELHIYNTATNSKKKLGDLITSANQRLWQIDLHPDNRSIIYQLKESSNHLWSLNNY
jgi:Tol biopolymer transport system component